MSRACNFDLSPCCQEPIIVAGEGLTHWYACKKCGQQVDGKPMKETNSTVEACPKGCRWGECSCERECDEPKT